MERAEIMSDKKKNSLIDTILSFAAFLAVVFFVVGGGMENVVKAVQGYEYTGESK